MIINKKIISFIRNHPLLLWALVLTLLSRILWLSYFHPVIASDARWYMEKSCSLAHGLGYLNDGQPTANYPPGYCFFLVIFFRLFDCQLPIARILNLLLYLFIILTFYLTIYQLTRNKQMAGWSSVFLSVYPNHVAYVNLVYNETFFLFLFLTAFYFLRKGTNFSKKSLYLSVSSLFWGIALLTRPGVFFVPLMIMIICYLNYCFPRKKLFFNVFLIYALIILVISPWTIRNYRIFGTLIPVSANAGFALLIGNNPHAEGRFYRHADFFKDIQEKPDEIRYNKIAKKMAITYILSHPGDAIKRLPQKAFYFFWPGMDGINWNRIGETSDKQNMLKKIALTGNAVYLLMLFLYVISILSKSIRRNLNFIDVAGISLIIYYLCLSLIFFGESRYHFHLIPFIIFSVTSYILNLLKWLPEKLKIIFS